MNHVGTPLCWRDEELYLVAERGYMLYQQGRFREAELIFDGLRVIAPQNTYYAHALTTIYIKTARPEAALAVLDAMLGSDSADDESRIRRCEALIECGRLEEARNEWRALWNRRRDPRLTRLALRLGLPVFSGHL